MKVAISFLLVFFFGGDAVERLPKWNFYYNKQLILEGDPKDGRVVPQAKLVVDAASPGEIVATFNYDVKSTFSSRLEVKTGNQTLLKLEYTSNPSGIGIAPTVKNGSVFTISLVDILVKMEKDTAALDFYYSDDHVSNEMVGTVDLIRER